MSKEMTLIVLGIWIVVVPYLGVPGSWRTAFLVLSGIAIAVIGFLLRGEALGRGTPASKHATFIDNIAPHDQPHSLPDTHEHQKEGITSLN